MPPKVKPKFTNDAHVPINEKRHNVMNLLNNDRSAMKSEKVGKKKAISKFAGGVHEGTGKQINRISSMMGVKGLKKTAASKKNADAREGEEKEGERGRKEVRRGVGAARSGKERNDELARSRAPRNTT